MPLPSAGVRAAQTSVRNNIAMLHVDGLKNGGPSAKEIPLGAFLGACHFDAEILSFKIIWLDALFDAPKRTISSQRVRRNSVVRETKPLGLG
jgi:hypothetical protein